MDRRLCVTIRRAELTDVPAVKAIADANKGEIGFVLKKLRPGRRKSAGCVEVSGG
jgi:hypothetical protein